MSVLEKIKDHKISEVALLKAEGARSRFETAARKAAPPRDFLSAIERRCEAGEIALIGEIKRASPSKGVIRADFDVAALARAYRNGGAACLSVLTDTHFFAGAGEHVAVASHSSLPVLCKDFLIDPIQVLQARALGADAVILILAMIDDALALDLEAAALHLGLTVLIETHDEHELGRALKLRSRLIGINNRDLKSFAADLGVTERLAARVGRDRLIVSESGISGCADVRRLADAGVRAFLIGESLLKIDNLEDATRQITQCWRRGSHGHAFVEP